MDIWSNTNQKKKDPLKVSFTFNMNTKNINGRTYDKFAMIKALEDFNKIVNEGSAYVYEQGHHGELKHIQGIIEDLKINETKGSVIANIKLMPPPIINKDVKTLILNHCKIAPSGTGYTTLDNVAVFDEIDGFNFIPK